MQIQTTMKNYYLQSLAVRVLRAVSEWSRRHYRRELLREALWRIGREMAASRQGRSAPREGLLHRSGQTQRRQSNRKICR